MIKSALNHQLESTSSAASRELLTRTLQSVDVLSKHGAGAFMACFCENGDLLSQWRGYGSLGGGFSLGFKAKQLKNRLWKYSGINEGRGFFKVLYGFAEEREWRLVIFRKLDHQSLKFRSAGTRIVPFFELDMGMDTSSGPSLLPLTRVVCGPTQSQEISKKAIEMRLGKEYPKGSVEITSSSVPLRV
jgi:hypothetical protein